MRPVQKKIVSVNEEPAYEPSGEIQEVVLKLTAKADKVHYYTTTEMLQFRPTMMFQTRVHRFDVKNNSRVGFSYDWNLLNDAVSSRPGTNPDVRTSSRASAAAPKEPDCPFEFIPRQGCIAAGRHLHLQCDTLLWRCHLLEMLHSDIQPMQTCRRWHVENLH